MTLRRSGRAGRKPWRESVPRYKQQPLSPQWPTNDIKRWKRATTKESPLDRIAWLANLSSETIILVEKSYGSFIAWLDSVGELHLDEPVFLRVTYNRLGAFIESQKLHVRASTLDNKLTYLKFALKAMEPTHEWDWVTRHSSRPTAQEVRASRKPIKQADSSAWLKLAQTYFFEASKADLHTAAMMFRNGLLIYFQAVFTLRCRNLAEIVIGKHLVKRGKKYFLQFQETVKNQEDIDYEIPAHVFPWLESYLSKHRLVLLNGTVDHLGLWVAEDGPQLAKAGVAAVFKKAGIKESLSTASTHPFRHSKATAFILRNPKDTELAAAALGHRGTSSVNQVYDQSGGLGASRAWNQIVKRRFRTS